MTWWQNQQVPAPAITPQPALQQSHYQSLNPSLAVPQAPSTPAAGIAPEWMELDSSNAAKFVSLHGEILTEAGPGQWHKVTIMTPIIKRERQYVIAAINKRISPQKLIPYFFSMENRCITFYVTNCGVELKTLCRLNLTVPYFSTIFDKIEMKLKLFSKNFNLPETMKVIVSKRLDSEKKYLDLSQLSSIPEVEELLFDPYDCSHIVDQLLRTAEIMAPGLVSLSVASNGLESLNPLWDFLHNSKWKSLRLLDLTDNKLKNTGTVFLARTLHITELHMHGNPICGIYKKNLYESVIKAALPRLYKLDGTYLQTSATVPYWKPNFIASGAFGDAAELADQFVEHFFTLYDQTDRMNLRGLYHKDAYFSFGCLYLDAQFTTPYARLSCYVNETRNLLRSSERKKSKAMLTRGSENILERISELPMTLHDPYTFTVDLLLHSKNLTILTVTGMFRDIVKEKRAPRHFMRTFVLTGVENDEYQIINDIMYVTNAATRESEGAFRFVKPLKIVKKKRPLPNLSEVEKESMTGLVEQLTSMSAAWSRKCLEDSDWDLKEALEVFVVLYEMCKIPKSAFSNPKK